MVIDARITNCHFADPDHVHLATWASFSSLEVDSGPPVNVSGADIMVALYAILMPKFSSNGLGWKESKPGWSM